MASTTVLTPPMPITRQRYRSIRAAGIVLVVALLAITAFVVDRAVQDRRPAHPAPAAATSNVASLPAVPSVAAVEAQLSTPEGLAAFQSAFARSFAPGSFGAKPSPSPEPLTTSQSALAHEFATGSFGAKPSSSPDPSSIEVCHAGRPC